MLMLRVRVLNVLFRKPVFSCFKVLGLVCHVCSQWGEQWGGYEMERGGGGGTQLLAGGLGDRMGPSVTLQALQSRAARWG